MDRLINHVTAVLLVMGGLICTNALAGSALELDSHSGDSISPGNADLTLPGWQKKVYADLTKFTPVDLAAGELFSVRVYEPIRRRYKAADYWLRDRLDAEARHRGRSFKRGTMRQTKNPFETHTQKVSYQDDEGRQRHAILVAAMLNRNKIGLVRLDYSNPKQLERYQTGYAKILHNAHFSVEHRADMKAAKRRQDLRNARWTAPGEGLQPEQIRMLEHNAELSMLATGVLRLKVKIRLLLEDGTVYTGLDLPPSDFNVDGSRQHEPHKWSTWRKQSGHYQINTGNNTWQTLKGDLYTPREADFRLDLNLTHIKATGSIYAGSGHNRDAIRLYPDGRFERSSFGLSMSDRGLSDAGFSKITSTRSKDKNGSRSTLSAIDGGTAISNTRNSRAGGNDMTGNYRINGFTIEFAYDNGRIERQLFFLRGLKAMHVIVGHKSYKNATYYK